MYICGTLLYDQTAEGHQRVYRHFWARTREEQREEVRPDPKGVLVQRRQQLVVDCPSRRPHCVHQLTLPPVSQWHALSGPALDDMVGSAPLPSDPDSRLPARFRNHIAVLIEV